MWPFNRRKDPAKELKEVEMDYKILEVKQKIDDLRESGDDRIRKLRRSKDQIEIDNVRDANVKLLTKTVKELESTLGIRENLQGKGLIEIEIPPDTGQNTPLTDMLEAQVRTGSLLGFDVSAYKGVIMKYLKTRDLRLKCETMLIVIGKRFGLMLLEPAAKEGKIPEEILGMFRIEGKQIEK